MKLQKIHTILLGLALIVPQVNLNATANPGKFSWFGSLASLGAKTLTLPFTTLSFCYRNLFAGAVLAGAAYLGYRYAKPKWDAYQNELSKNAKACYEKISSYCTKPNCQKFIALDEQEQITEIEKIQTVLNKCSWSEWFHSTFLHKLPFARGGQAQLFFDTLKKAKSWSSYNNQAKRTYLKNVANNQATISTILAEKYSGITPETIVSDQKATSGEKSFAVEMLLTDNPQPSSLVSSSIEHA